MKSPPKNFSSTKIVVSNVTLPKSTKFWNKEPTQKELSKKFLTNSRDQEQFLPAVMQKFTQSLIEIKEKLSQKRNELQPRHFVYVMQIIPLWKLYDKGIVKPNYWTNPAGMLDMLYISRCQATTATNQRICRLSGVWPLNCALKCCTPTDMPASPVHAYTCHVHAAAVFIHFLHPFLLKLLQKISLCFFPMSTEKMWSIFSEFVL